MDDFVQLLDLQSGDVVADFPTEAEAIAALNAVLTEYGDQSVEELALLRFRNGRPSLIAMEKRLVRHVSDALASSRGVHEPRAGSLPSQESWNRAFELRRTANTSSLTILQTRVRYEFFSDELWARPARKATATHQMVLDLVT